MLPSNDIDRFEDEGKTGDYLSSTYNLVYYPIKEDGSYDFDNGTYKFPRDVRIGFFIICQGYPKMIAKGEQGRFPIPISVCRFPLSIRDSAIISRPSTEAPTGMTIPLCRLSPTIGTATSLWA